MTAMPATELLLGGAGGVYLLASPGELIIRIFKRDLNQRRRHTELRAILAGPDRAVVQEATIPDDGAAVGSGMGPEQSVQLRIWVRTPGIYALNITVSQDRYGEDYAWGFRTNCPRYMIETSRGHRDARHQEPIVLRGGSGPADICFLPRPAAFAVQVTGLPPESPPLQLFDAGGALRAELPRDSAGAATVTLSADPDRGATPWRLHLPVPQAQVHIDGVTRWEAGDPYPDLSLWTDRPDAFFPLQPCRWLLTPYHRTVYAAPGEELSLPLRVQNNGPEADTLDLAAEFDGRPWPADLAESSVPLGARSARTLMLHAVAGGSGEIRRCRVRVTSRRFPQVTTYASVAVHTGTGPVSRPLDMPVLLTPYRHENAQFGYLPQYPVDAGMYFAPDNTPFTLTHRTLAVLARGAWKQFALRGIWGSAGIETALVRTQGCSKVAFDLSGDAYLIGWMDGRPALLHSADQGRTFDACALASAAGRGMSFDMEEFTGHNQSAGPPAILRATETAADPRHIWRRISTLDLLLPRKDAGAIVCGPPIRIAAATLGVGSHSGIPSAVVSRGDRVHVIWAEPTDPADQVRGVPTFVATYDRTTGQLSQPALIGYGAPPNDVHNRPSLTMDSQGYLHALAGTHGQPFQYARSLVPNDASQGWTDPVPVGDRQTYIGMVCGPDDVLHLVYRLWRDHQEPFPHSMHAALAYQRKLPGQPWSPPRVLVVAPFSEYSIFYHKLTIDRQGRLFLSYDYWSTYWFYRTDHVGSRRALMMSADGGFSWKLVETRDLE